MQLSTGLASTLNLLTLLVASCSGELTQREKVFEQTHGQLKQLLHKVETQELAQSPSNLEQLRFILNAYYIDQSKCNRNYLQELRNHEVSYRFNDQLAISNYLDQCEQELMKHCASALNNLIKGELEKFNQDEIKQIDDLMFQLKNSNLVKGLLSFVITIPITSFESQPSDQNESLRMRFEFVEKICSNLTTRLGSAFNLYKDDYVELRRFLEHQTERWLTNLELCEEILNDRALFLLSIQKLFVREKEKYSRLGIV